MPTAAVLSASLVYGGSIPNRDMTLDNRTRFDLSGANNLFTVQTIGGYPTIVPNQTATSGGIGIVRVYWTSGAAVSATLTIQIVWALFVTLSASPYPTFAGSTAMVATQLAPYANTGVYQQAVMAVTLTLSDASTRTVSADANLAYNITIAGAPQTPSTNIVTITAGGIVAVVGSGGMLGPVDIYASLYGQTSPAPFRITSVAQPVRLIALQNLVFVSTLVGLVGTQSRPTVGALFSDGTRYPSVFSSSVGVVPGVNLPNLVSVVSSLAGVASANTSTGITTLYQNYPTLLTLSVTGTVNTSVVVTSQFAANLDPEVGDIDLGNAAGLPLNPMAPTGTVCLAVRVNTGALSVGAVDLSLLYDNKYVSVLSGTQGAAWTSGTFLANLNVAPGVVAFGGTPVPFS